METGDGNSNTGGTEQGGMAVADLTLERFKAALNTGFHIRCEDAHIVDLTLVEAHSVRSPDGGDGDGSFSIVFSGPGDRLLTQRIYRMASEVMGEFDLFIVPVGREKDGYRYQAIFNRQPCTP